MEFCFESSPCSAARFQPTQKNGGNQGLPSLRVFHLRENTNPREKRVCCNCLARINRPTRHKSADSDDSRILSFMVCLEFVSIHGKSSQIILYCASPILQHVISFALFDNAHSRKAQVGVRSAQHLPTLYFLSRRRRLAHNTTHGARGFTKSQSRACLDVSSVAP
jgi:hypothetical protein